MRLFSPLYRNVFLVVLSGVISGLGVLFPDVWFFGALGVVPFAYVLYQVTDPKSATILGFIFGLAYSGAAIMWFWDVLPLDWTGTTAIKGFIFVGFSWSMVTLILGVFFSLFAVAFMRLKTGTWQDIPLAASLWTVLQYLQMWGFAFLTAPGLSVGGPHFSPTMLGYSLAAFSPLLQLASIGGVYILTFLAAGLGFTLYHALLCNGKSTRLATMAIILLVVGIALYDKSHPLISTRTAPDVRTTRVALVSTDFSVAPARTKEEQAVRSDVVETIVRTGAKDMRAPDIVIFPEAAEFFAHSKTDPLTLGRESFGVEISFVDSGTAQVGLDRFVNMRFYDKGIRTSNTYWKIFLVPQGEYAPWLFKKLLQLIGVSKDEQRVMHERMVTAGTHTEVALIAGVRAGALFCSDALSPRLYTDLTRDGAELLINASSHSWFHSSPRVDALAVTLAKVRAVESDRFLVTAGNSVPSRIISNRGEVTARSTQEAPLLSGTVPLGESRTPYVRFGELLLVIPLCILLAFFVKNSRRRI